MAIADGGDHVTDLGVLRGRQALVGAVASESTAHRAIKSVDGEALEALRTSRQRRCPRPEDTDARPQEADPRQRRPLLAAHCEKGASARQTTRATSAFTYCSVSGRDGEPLAAVLRPGSAGANTASDHFEVLQLALEQLSAQDLDREILARTDTGGRTYAFISDCRDAGIRFSVSCEVDERMRGAIAELPEAAWRSAIDAMGPPRGSPGLRARACRAQAGAPARLLHIAGRMVRPGRRVVLRLPRS